MVTWCQFKGNVDLPPHRPKTVGSPHCTICHDPDPTIWIQSYLPLNRAICITQHKKNKIFCQTVKKRPTVAAVGRCPAVGHIPPRPKKRHPATILACRSCRQSPYMVTIASLRLRNCAQPALPLIFLLGPRIVHAVSCRPCMSPYPWLRVSYYFFFFVLAAFELFNGASSVNHNLYKDNHLSNFG